MSLYIYIYIMLTIINTLATSSSLPPISSSLIDDIAEGKRINQPSQLSSNVKQVQHYASIEKCLELDVAGERYKPVYSVDRV